MSLLTLTLILLTVTALSAGQILFKMAAPELNLSIYGLVGNILNPKLFFALVIYFIATVMWLLVLKVTPLRIAYPFSALAFFMVPIFSYFLLGESLHWNTFAGAGLIALGVWVCVYQ